MNSINNNTERYALLLYDIPSKSELRNPSGLLRRFGVRRNKSVWILPMKNVALIPLKEWAEKGADLEVVEFAEHESDKIIAMAKRALTREVETMRANVEKLVGAVRKKLAKANAMATGSDEQLKAFEKTERYAYASLYRAKAVADAAEESALHFDLTGDVAVLVDGLRQSIKAKSAMFFSMQQQRSTQTTLVVSA